MCMHRHKIIKNLISNKLIRNNSILNVMLEPKLRLTISLGLGISLLLRLGSI